MNKEVIWNAVAATIGIAVIGVMGWQALTIIRLENHITEVKATRFSRRDGDGLKAHITDDLTDIDKRLAIMERDVDWVRQWLFESGEPKHAHELPQPAPMPKPQDQVRRYDLRK